MNIWMVIGIVLLILLSFFLFSSVRIELRYLRNDKDDEAIITFYALGNLIRYKKKITQLIWKGFDEGVKTKSTPQQAGETNEEWLTEEKIQKLKESTQVLVEQIDHFYRIMKQFMNRITCETLHWETSLGTGNAAETGVLIGGFWGVKTTLISVLGRMIQWDQQPNLQIHPYFNEAKLEIDFHSIIRFRIGHAILAFNRLVYQLLIKEEG